MKIFLISLIFTGLVHILGRVCVPIDMRRLEDFDPFNVPTIRFVNYNRDMLSYF